MLDVHDGVGSAPGLRTMHRAAAFWQQGDHETGDRLLAGAVAPQRSRLTVAPTR